MQTKLESVLLDLGLNDNEAKTYLVGLKIGPTTVMQLSKECEIPRTNVYYILDSLREKGLSYTQMNGWKKMYVMSEPKQLQILLEQKKRKLDNLIPQFEAIYKLPEQESTFEYYEGLEGVKNVYEDLLNSVNPKDDYLIQGNIKMWYQLDTQYFGDFLERRAGMGLKIRNLFTDTPEARNIQKYQNDYNMQVKILPKNTILTTNLVIIPKKVVIHQLVPPIMAIVISNPNIIKMHRETFEILWDGL